MHKNITINAALEELIASKEPAMKAASILIEYSLNLPEFKLKSRYITMPKNGEMPMFKKTGNYHIWKVRDNQINFRRWNGTLEKNGEKENTIKFFFLLYNKETLAPEIFGHYEAKVYKSKWIHLVRLLNKLFDLIFLALSFGKNIAPFGFDRIFGLYETTWYDHWKVE